MYEDGILAGAGSALSAVILRGFSLAVNARPSNAKRRQLIQLPALGFCFIVLRDYFGSLLGLAVTYSPTP